MSEYDFFLVGMIVGILSIVNGILLKSKNGKLSMNVTTILVSLTVSYNVNKLTKGMRKKELFEFKVPDLYIGTDIAFSALYFLASGVALWQNYY